jgi:hypothetical protein
MSSMAAPTMRRPSLNLRTTMATRFAVKVQTRSSSSNLLDHSPMARFVVKTANVELRAAENSCSVITLPRGMSCASVICFEVER